MFTPNGTPNSINGYFIVLIVLIVFLGWRVSLMTAIGIPFCYLGTIIVLDVLGMNFVGYRYSTIPKPVVRALSSRS